MISPEVSAELARLEAAPAERFTGYPNLLRGIAQNAAEQQTENLKAYVDSILGESLGIVAARPLLASFVDALKELAHNDAKVEIGQHTLALIQPRVVSFEEQDANLRALLAEAFESLEEHVAAAKVLANIQLDSTQRSISDDDKLRVWIRIVRNYLEVDDTTNAEAYLNRAKSLFYKCQDQELKLMFQLSQARIYDARRKFLDACQAYHSLSFSAVVVEEERMRALSSAIVCAVLAPAGPQRSRALSRLYKDERSMQVPEFGILEKMFLDRLLSPEEVQTFAANLSEHHLARTGDGSTVLEKAVIEHNLLGTSRLYENIGVEDLGKLLGTSGERAEEYAARMIEQGRLSGRIDQIDSVIFFDGEESAGVNGSASSTSRKELSRWDANVQGLTEEVEKVTTLLQNEYPEFVAGNLVH